MDTSDLYFESRKREDDAVSKILSRSQKHSENKLPSGFYCGAIPIGDELISIATDGVGSKILLTELFNSYATIGIDCVAMNVNDLICSGSIPKGFVDYLALREPDSEKIDQILSGIIQGCKESEIPLLGGETAILPDILRGSHNLYDLSGTAIGGYDGGEPITGATIQQGDVILGLRSSGVHSNGFTLIRNLFKEDEMFPELLEPTTIYVKAIKDLLRSDLRQSIHGMAHITGGGYLNLLRLGKFMYNLDSWEVPEVFQQIQAKGLISPEKMFTTFNMGYGFIVIVSREQAEEIVERLSKFHGTSRIGTVMEGNSIQIGDIRLEAEK